MNLDFLFVFISLIVITVLIVVHEFGHWLAARYFGFQTPIFGIGLPFGPYIDLFKKWDTQFRFHFFLIGGFVSIPELGDETNPETVKELKLKKPLKSFPVWQRAIVASGGIIFNVLFALLLTIVMSATIGLPKAAADSKITDLIKDNPIAANAGIKSGDTITAVGATEIFTGEELKKELQKYKSESVVLTIKRPIKVDGSVKGKAPEFKILKLSITPNADGAVGVILSYKQEYEKLSNNPLLWVWESIKLVSVNIVGMFFAIIGLFVALFSKIFSIFTPGQIETGVQLDQVKGIVGIIQLISEDIQENWMMVFQFSILLSLNLAVINVLPIPALDGGHLMFMAYEAILGKKPSEKIQEQAVQYGFMFLLGVILLTTVNDIKNWIFG